MSMALFRIHENKLALCKPINFKLEKDLQGLVEQNLNTIFSCTFVASEFPTGTAHSGRIDTLAISEDGNPVILEYKKVESSKLLNQSLYYLNWIIDHRGDFQVAANKALGKEVKIDWDDVRVICLAPGYTKYDLHAAQVMGASIELWQYRLFDDGSFYIEEVFRRSTASTVHSDTEQSNTKDPIMVAAGKKAAITRATGIYSVDEHLDKTSGKFRTVVESIRELILSIDANIEEVPKKFYIAYKTTKNFVCLDTRQTKLYLFLKLDPEKLDNFPQNGRDVTDIGHYGTGDFELTIKNLDEAIAAEDFIRQSFESVGG
jgi:predicted transport protein